jgi:hypothetical protein
VRGCFSSQSIVADAFAGGVDGSSSMSASRAAVSLSSVRSDASDRMKLSVWESSGAPWFGVDVTTCGEVSPALPVAALRADVLPQRLAARCTVVLVTGGENVDAVAVAIGPHPREVVRVDVAALDAHRMLSGLTTPDTLGPGV